MKMIPVICPESTQSHAEREIFDLLSNLDIPGVVMYSLQLNKHVTKLQSEIDFVLISARGILCLEVKGGDVAHHNGIWEYTNSTGNVYKHLEGPFVQASSGAQSLRLYIKDNYKKSELHKYKTCLYGHGVLFPDITFSQKGPGIDNEIIYDGYKYEKIEHYINHLYDHWESKLEERFGNEKYIKTNLTSNDIGILGDFLRNEFTTEESHNHFNFKAVDGQLHKLSEEQMRIFKYGVQNPRQLVSGGAGTGKTIIALLHAIEQAKAGKKVLFLCFNKLLSDWVYKEISNELPGVISRIKVINFHNLLLEVVGCEIPDSNLSEFYHEELPSLFISQTDKNPFEAVDLLIVDEGQDLFKMDYILCMDRMVKDGLDSGQWLVFYDEYQNIYLKEKFDEGIDMMKSFSPFIGLLTTNYRNTRQIHEANNKITKIDNKIFTGIDGDEVTYIGYKTNDEATCNLIQIIKTLAKQNVPFEEVVILSPHRFENSLIEGNRNLFEGIGQIQPMQNKEGKLTKLIPGTIRFSSIHSFKGMESHVVILIDIDRQDDEAMRLYYTGISRAKSKLYIMYDEGKFVNKFSV